MFSRNSVTPCMLFDCVYCATDAASSVAGIRVHAGAGLHDVDDDEPDDQRERAHHFEVQQRERARLADLLHVLHAGDAEHHRAEDDRRDQHLDQLDEAVAQRLHRLPGFGPEIPEQHAGHDGDEHLHVERCVERPPARKRPPCGVLTSGRAHKIVAQTGT